MAGPGSLGYWHLSELELDPDTGRVVSATDPHVIADEHASEVVVSIALVRHCLRVWQQLSGNDETPEVLRSQLAASVDTTHARMQLLSDQLFR